MDQPLTYEALFDSLRREKSRDELQALERDFYARVRDFLAAKDDEIRTAGTTTLAGARAQIEHQNVRKILRELYERRERKIVTMALHRTRTDAAIVDTAVLLPEEEGLFAALCAELERARVVTLRNAEAPIAAHSAPISDGPLEAEPRGRIIPARPVAPPNVSVDDGDTTSGEAVEAPFVTVRFTSAVPKFSGPDGEVRGPFQAGDESSVPRQVAEILVRKGKAQEAMTPG